MTAEPRRNRGPARTGGQGPPDVRRGRPRVAGQRAAERRREAEPPSEPKPKRGLPVPGLSAPRLPAPRLPRLRRGKSARPSPVPTSSPRLTLVLAVLVVLATVGVGYLAFQLRNAQDTQSAADTAQVTAAQYAEQLLSYHHQQLERDFSESRELLTDGFRKEYVDATKVVREEAVADKAVIKASVVATSVVSAEPDRVRTLLFVNQSTTTGNGTSPSIDLNRVELTLVEQDGRWLVSDLDAM